MICRTGIRPWLVALCLAMLLGGLALPALPVAASTLHVTDCGDAGANTLRGKIASAAVGDTIVFDQDCAGATAITLATGTLTLAQNVTIDGTGHTVTVDGGCTLSGGVCASGGVTVFTVVTGITASLIALTIQHGNDIHGGGIFNQGTLSVTNCTLSGNSGSNAGAGGGAIRNFNGGTLSVTNSTLSGNSTIGGGGAIYGFSDTVTVTNSTISGNTSTLGGGIDMEGSGHALTVTNSTISGNAARGSEANGGGIFNILGTVSVVNSTISGNSADNLGGGIDNVSNVTVTNSTISGNSAITGGAIFNEGTVEVVNGTISGNTATMNGGGIKNNFNLPLTNTIVAGNTAASHPDVEGILGEFGGHNLFGNTSGTSGFNPGDLRDVNPQLGTLHYNGGPTQTMLLNNGSPAIGAGDATACTSAPVSGKDQRGFARPVATCAIGAFEPQNIAPLPPPKPPGPAGGPPSPLPAVRPAGPAAGSAPNPLPNPRS